MQIRCETPMKGLYSPGLSRTSSSTTPGSASVDVSPSAPNSPSAILRRMRRMILPERVYGSPGANFSRGDQTLLYFSNRRSAFDQLVIAMTAFT